MNRFNICQAYAQLESDYNVGGFLRERPSNDCDAEEVREIYMRAVLRLSLPIDDGLRAAMTRFFVPEYLAGFPQFQGV